MSNCNECYGEKYNTTGKEAKGWEGRGRSLTSAKLRLLGEERFSEGTANAK